MTAVVPVLDPAAHEHGEPDITHISETCCDPHTRTLCGQPISRSAWRRVNAPASEACVVCADLHRLLIHCSRCGKRLA